MISSVVALHTTFARACPAIVFLAAKSRSTRLCPPGCIVGGFLITFLIEQKKFSLKEISFLDYRDSDIICQGHIHNQVNI
jgi:hypothetical protein